MHETVEWLYALQHFGIKLGLDNIRALLRELGHPEKALKCVHVAGTNGKGSVAAMIDAMLESSGVRSGLFTSPHLVRPNERIRIAGEDIDSDELHRRLDGMRTMIADAKEGGRLETQPSFFEVVTATALHAFEQHGLEAAVLEVGLGGRLDATNAVAADVGVIVSIALDHTKTLGPTIEKIAVEKAGIIKPGMPVVSGVVQQRAIDVIRQTCDRRGARWIDARLEVKLVHETPSSFSLATARAAYRDLRPALVGRHQIDNTRVAIAAFELLMERMGHEVDPEAVRQGLATMRWPGRLEWVAPDDGLAPMLFDSAHNPAGVDALARHLVDERRGKAVLLFGATTGKPLERLIDPLLPFVEAAVITRPPVPRGLDPEEVAELVRSRIDAVSVAAEPRAALEVARGLAGADGYVLVTGSLYLVGHVLGLLTPEEVPGPVAM
jgi:dihydrofolate synthase/folylpolyglutamate synthase